MSGFLPSASTSSKQSVGNSALSVGSEKPVFRVSWGLWDLRRIGDRKGLCKVSHKSQDNFQLDWPEQGWVVVLLMRRAEGKEPTEGQVGFIGHMQGPRAHPCTEQGGPFPALTLPASMLSRQPGTWRGSRVCCAS